MCIRDSDYCAAALRAYAFTQHDENFTPPGHGGTVKYKTEGAVSYTHLDVYKRQRQAMAAQ